MAKRRTTKVSDDNGVTRRLWGAIDGPQLNPEDWESLSIIKGATGKPVGRPPKSGKSPLQDLDERNAFFYGYIPSTPDDWAREIRERREALAKVEEQKCKRK